MHLQVLNKDTESLWDKCGFLSPQFYLAGGTALALQIGHRISIDLYFFTDNPLKKNLLTILENNFSSQNITVLVNNPTEELTCIIEGVKITLLHYPFINLHPVVVTNIATLASILDIASQKAYALGRRTSLKDYVDLYTVLNNQYISLSQLITDSITKYGEAFNTRMFFEQLLSPEDLENDAIEYLGVPPKLDTIKEYFTEIISEYSKNS